MVSNVGGNRLKEIIYGSVWFCVMGDHAYCRVERLYVLSVHI
jgi:hypothetical protein